MKLGELYNVGIGEAIKDMSIAKLKVHDDGAGNVVGIEVKYLTKEYADKDADDVFGRQKR